MTQDEFLLLLRKQAGAPEVDSLAEKTLVTAWRMSQAGDSESVKNAENILNFATVEPAIKNIVKQQFGQVAVAPAASVETPLAASPENVTPSETQNPIELDSLLQGNDEQVANNESQTISIPSTRSEIDPVVELTPVESPTVVAETTPVESVETIPETIPLEPAPVTIDPVASILAQSSMTTPVTQTIKKETPDDIISRVISSTENRKLSRSEEFEQLIKQTKQEEIKKEVELEKPQAVIHTYEVPAEKEQEQNYHSVEDRLKAEKAEPFFARCEAYLKKAYENGSSSIITSAENQFESLKKRFPEFVELYPDRIAEIESMKTSQASEELDSVDVSGVLVKKGMTITSSHVYQVSKIIAQGSTTMVHFSDETLRNYKLTALDLQRGLETPGIDADVFFDEFRVN